MTALNTFAATLAPGQFAQFACPSLTAMYDGVAYPFEPSAAARAAAQAGNWSAVHMADWWSHMPWDQASDTYWIAGGRDRFQPLAQNLVSYNANTNQWTHRPAWSGLGGGHCYQGTAVGNGKVYGYTLTGTSVWDQATESLAGTIPAPPSNVVPAFSNSLAAGGGSVFVPWMGAQGSVLFVNCNAHGTDPTRGLSRIFRRDLALNSWVPVLGQRGLWNNQHTLAVRSRHTQTVLVGATRSTQQLKLGILDAAGGLTFMPLGPFSLSTAGSNAQRGLVVEHPLRNEWIVFCLATGRIWSAAPSDPAWVDRGPVPADLVNTNSVALPTTFGAAFVRYRSAGLSQMWAWVPGW